MKRYITAAILALSTISSQAHQPARYYGSYLHTPSYHHHHHSHSQSWIAPLIIGGVVGYALNRPTQAQAQVAPATVYAPVTVLPPATTERSLPPAPIGYRYEQILDAGCNCYRWVLLPN